MNRYLLEENDEYYIYRMSIPVYGEESLNYYLCFPKDDISKYKTYVGFPQIDLKAADEEKVFDEIEKVYSLVKLSDKDAVYILPEFDLTEFEEATKDNDFKLYNLFFGKLSMITYDLSQFITNDIGKKYENIDQNIQIVKQNDKDTKLCHWMEIGTKASSFIKGVSYDELARKYLDKTVLTNNEEKLEKNIMVSPIVREHVPVSVNKNNVKSTGKKRILAKPNINHYGFSSIYSIGFILLLSIFAGTTLGLILLK